MNWIKKIGISVAAICLFFIPAYAEDLNVTDISGYIENGTAVYSAKIFNEGTVTANPVMVLAVYQNNVLQEWKICKTSGIAAGENASLSVSVDEITVDDATKIIGFIWENTKYRIPIDVTEIERMGSNDTGISGFLLTGIDSDFIDIDNENKLIQVKLPLYDREGAEIDITSIETAVTVNNQNAAVKIDDTALSGEDLKKFGTVDYSSASEIIVTAEDGTEMSYELELYRIISENFESGLISGYSVGDSNNPGKLIGDFSIAGESTQKYIKYNVQDYGGGTQFLDGVSIGVLDINDAKLINQGGVIPVGESGASGKALQLRKDTHDNSNTSTGITRFRIENIPDLADADEIVVEYDVAYDFNVQGIAVNPYVAGLDIGIDTTRICGPNSNNNPNGVILVFNQSTTYDLNKWHHIKAVLTKNSSGNADMVTYIDGTDTGIYSEEDGVIWPTYFQFAVSNRRCIGLWIDNISISYK